MSRSAGVVEAPHVARVPETVSCIRPPKRAERATGRGMNSAVRSSMEQHFGESFAGVSIHGAPSDDAPWQQGHAAATLGEQVAFAAGRYSPASVPGRMLLAHELAHVAQQRRFATNGGRPSSVAAAESEADRAAVGAALGRPIAVTSARPPAAAFSDDDEHSWLSRARHAVRDEVQSYSGHALGLVEGVVTEAATAADTVLWADERATQLMHGAVDKAADAVGMSATSRAVAHQVAESTITAIPGVGTTHLGLRGVAAIAPRDPVTGTPSLATGVGRVGDAVDRARVRLVGEGHPEYGIFTAREMGQLEGALGTQIALLFVDAEEIQLALRGLAALQSVQAIDQAIAAHPGTWMHEFDFWSAVAQAVLFVIGLHASRVGARLRELLVDAGMATLASAGPVVHLADDYRNYHGEDRDRRIAHDIQGVVRALAQGVMTAINHGRQARRGAGSGASAPDSASAPASRGAYGEAPPVGAHAPAPASPSVPLASPNASPSPAAAPIARPSAVSVLARTQPGGEVASIGTARPARRSAASEQLERNLASRRPDAPQVSRLPARRVAEQAHVEAAQPPMQLASGDRTTHAGASTTTRAVASGGSHGAPSATPTRPALVHSLPTPSGPGRRGASRRVAAVDVVRAAEHGLAAASAPEHLAGGTSGAGVPPGGGSPGAPGPAPIGPAPRRLGGATAEGSGRDFTHQRFAPAPAAEVISGRGSGMPAGERLTSYAHAVRSTARKNPATAAAGPGPFIHDNLYTGPRQARTVNGLAHAGILTELPGGQIHVAQPERYVAWLERAYQQHAGVRMDPQLRAAIETYVASGRLQAAGVHPVTGAESFAGSLPGTHAEILAVNEVLARGEHSADVATVRAKAGDHFIACVHCASILRALSPRVNIFTGAAVPPR